MELIEMCNWDAKSHWRTFSRFVIQNLIFESSLNRKLIHFNSHTHTQAHTYRRNATERERERLTIGERREERLEEISRRRRRSHCSPPREREKSRIREDRLREKGRRYFYWRMIWWHVGSLNEIIGALLELTLAPLKQIG